MAEIRVEALRKSFGSFTAVEDSTFTVNDGEFFCLLGPSGCGKTTTLRMIAGLELPTSGTIRLDGDDVSMKRASQRDIAMVFQMFALYPHMTVRKNISYPLTNVGMAKASVTARVEDAARILRITHLLDRSVGGLSGGDRQRVALGRAIVREPKAFMMDEPLGALDSEFRHIMCGELRALHSRLRATTVYVTHDQMEAMSMADKIAIMNKGIIEQLATPQEIYDRPATVFVASFIGQPAMNLITFEATIDRGSESVALDDVALPIPRPEQGGHGTWVLGVRPEHVRLADDAPLRGEVFGVEYLGTTQIVAVKTKRGLIRSRLPASTAVAIGSHVGLALNTRRASLFDGATGRSLALMQQVEAAHG